MTYIYKNSKQPNTDTSNNSFFSRPTRSFSIPRQPESPYRQNATGMPDQVLQKMESTFKTDFSNVRIYPNSPKAPQLGALAYTQGHHIHFAPGQYNPTSAVGKKILAHELTHVMQQRLGIVKPTNRIKGLPINEDPTLENHAETQGANST